MLLFYNKFYTEHGKNPIIASPEMINFAMKMGLIFYSEITGYGKSPANWNNRCNLWANDIHEGINIITFYGRQSKRGDFCTTYHHFIIWKYDDYCIIIDAWAGKGGIRGEWARIMKTYDINTILNEISITDDLYRTNILLNQYFIVPHEIKKENNIELSMQPELLYVGSIDLNSDRWNEYILKIFNLANEGFFLNYGGSK
jgi:hypothetical protein